jgi:ATP-dependent Clp protease ATP-binding subunit ClpX
MLAQEEDAWEEEIGKKTHTSSFQEYRKQGLVAGAGGYM